MNENIPATKKALTEALELSKQILKNIELNELPLENIALKVGRLARLLNDFEMQKAIGYEVSGYPIYPHGLPAEIYQLAVIAGREYEKEISTKDGAKSTEKYIYGNSIAALEALIKSNETNLLAASDPAISISSANPYQTIPIPQGNIKERINIKINIISAATRLASRRFFIYHYTLKKYYELKFSGIADDIFTRIRERADSLVGQLLPDAIKRFNAIYDNLQSNNSEDWSNAAHSCRRILKDLADAVFPPTNETRKKGKIEIKLKEDNYINRIIAFIEDNVDSRRFTKLTGSHISFIGERLDSIFSAANKGTHTDIISQEEADRYVIYTYLIVSDVLSLWEEKLNKEQ